MSISSFLKRNFIKNSAERHDIKYKQGHWKPLRDIHELGHYSIIAGYFLFLKKGGSILDIGCGEGILQERISNSNYSFYKGIDIAEEAIRIAKAKENSNTGFECINLKEFSTEERFDAVIFNEALYYVGKQAEVVKKYSSFLKNDGIFIFSNFLSQNNKICWSEIESSFPKYDQTIITNIYEKSWVCKVLLNNKTDNDH
jgi:2-polyprenyl-3-methyl-5-hydroxy-6-metoxy-1,4-benzoquinol methylase